jgi:hypothetical protein
MVEPGSFSLNFLSQSKTIVVTFFMTTALWPQRNKRAVLRQKDAK